MRTYSKLLIISVFAVAAFLGGTAEAWAGTCNCTVTSSNGTGNLQVSECTIHRVIEYDKCATITILDTLSGTKGTDTAPVTVTLDVGLTLDNISIVGPALDNGKPVVKFIYGSATSTKLIHMLSKASLNNVAISAPSKTAIQVSGSSNTIENVAISGSGTAIALLDSKSVDNHFINNAFSGNKSAIILGGGNQNTTPPHLVRSFKDLSTGVITLLVAAKTGATVKVFRADAAVDSQGVEALGEVKPEAALSNGLQGISPYSDNDVYSHYYLVPLLDNLKDTQIVLLSDLPGVGTSFFSPKFKPSDVLDEAPSSCMNASWFLNSAIKTTWESKSGGVWDYDFDGDKYTNGQEDKNHNCTIEKDKLESNPADKTDTPFVYMYTNLCLIDPAYCAVIFKIDLNKPADTKPAAKDFDLDGKADDVDVCPELKDAEQLDTDGDGIGDACDPDRDNDGLTNAQETVAGTNSMKADHDNDGYCDGPAWGKVVDGKTQCQPSDNCPLSSNAGQFDTDEDGIGDDCDLSLKDAFTSNTDSDSDGVKDFQENGLGDNCPAIKNPDQKDTDGDKVGDACDSDDDNDGLLDVVENSTRYTFYDKAKAFVKTALLNPLSPESDADPQDGKSDNSPDNVDMCPVIAAGAATDACDAIVGSIYTAVVNDTATDDCPTVKNFGMKGASKDVACDADIDGDGVKNADEDKQHTHFWEADSDHYKYNYLKNQGEGADGHNDKNDVCPANFGLSNVDFCSGKTAVADTDKDGKFDKQDNCQNKANPDQADLDKDNVGDACDDDIDGDGLKNDGDKCPKVSDPSNVCGQTKPTPDANPKFTPLAGPVTQDFQGGGGCALVTTTSSTSSAGLCLFIVFGTFAVLRMRLVDKTR